MATFFDAKSVDISALAADDLTDVTLAKMALLMLLSDWSVRKVGLLEAHQVILAARSRECCDFRSISTHPPTFSIHSANLLLKIAETSAEVSALKK